jgi:hypothetical protein
MSILETVREKPDNQKKLFALVGAIILTLLIVFVWYSFGSNRKSADLAAAVGESRLSSVSPWQVIKDEFSDAFSGLGDKISAFQSGSTTLDSNNTVPVEVVTLDSTLGTSTSTSIATSTNN